MKRQKNSGNPATVESLGRGLDILALFSSRNTELSGIEVSRQLGVSQSTAHRLLQTLQHKGYVRQNPDTRRYSLSFRVIELASLVLDSMQLRLQALPELEDLARVADAKANLAVRDGAELIYVARVESPRVPRMFFYLGKRAPLYATALGKVLLAYRAEEEWEAYINELPPVRYTAHTITSVDRLREEFRRTRSLGYAMDLGEYLEEVNCLAVPVFDRTQQVVAAISVSGSASYMTPARLEELRPEVQRVGRVISHKLGYWA